MRDTELHEFMENYRSESSDTITHVSMGSVNGRFSLPRHSLEEFWKLYCDGVASDDNNTYGLAEFPQAYVPFIIDLDIKAKSDKVKRLYKRNRLPDIVGLINEALRQTVHNYTDEDLTCLVLEKPPYRRENGQVSSGLHLHYPWLFLDSTKIQHYIYPKIVEYFRESNIFEPLNLTQHVTLDFGVVKTTWMMYGSIKKDGTSPYLVTKFFNHEAEEIRIGEALKHYKLYDVEGDQIELKGKIKYYLPRILSFFPMGRMSKEVKRDQESMFKEEILSEVNKKRKMPTFEERDNEDPVKDLEVAAKYLPLLSARRATDYEDWRKVGMILYNIGHGCRDSYEMWVEFSKRTQEDNFKEEVCIDYWENKMRPSNYTVGTIKYYAKKDNFEEYSKLKEVEGKKILYQNVSGTHRSVANMLYEEYSDSFVCASIERNMWFQFTNHTWQEVQGGFALRNIMSEKLPSKYDKILGALHLERSEAVRDKSMAPGEGDQIQEQIKKINKILRDLETHPFKQQVLRECCDIFFDPKFFSKLDSNEMLIGFQNGILDLRTCKLRDGQPDDYVSKCIPHDFVEYTESDPCVIEVNEFIEKLFPDPELKEYFLETNCEMFEGFNKRKIIQLWNGQGDNGKSMLMNLMDMAFGTYSIKLPTTVMTGKRTPSGGACPELARCGQGTRIATIQEPSRKDEANSGTLKELSGNDPFYARDLFKSGGDINPMFKLIVICNHLIRTDSEDPALWNRFRVLPFESKFPKLGDGPPVSRDYQEQIRQKRFPRDPEFQLKLPRMCKPFLWILLNHYRKLQTDEYGIRIEPEKVLAATERYKRENDIFLQYITECIIEDTKSTMSIKAMWDSYKDWFRSSYPGLSICNKLEMTEYLKKVWGEALPGTRWQGYRFREEEDDLRENKAFKIPCAAIAEDPGSRKSSGKRSGSKKGSGKKIEFDSDDDNTL